MPIKIKILYAALAVLLLYTVWPGHELSEEEVASIRVWDTHVDANGRLNVLGVALGNTTLKEAEAALHTQSERALFIRMEGEKHVSDKIEAYFPTSPDRAKLFLELAPDEALIDKIKKQAHKMVLLPSGNAMVEISPEHTPALEQLAVRSLTYVPPISLTPSMVEKNFGKADKRLTDIDGNIHILYPKLGLDVVIAREGKPLLQFVSPSEFDRLLSLINTDTAPQ